MTPFCDRLAETLPESKFIVLVRDPRDFVRSGMRRNYYRGHPWDVGRLKPKAGTDGFAEWTALDDFDKILGAAEQQLATCIVLELCVACWRWRDIRQTISPWR